MAPHPSKKVMARRGPLELRRIEARTSRQVRFSKRRSGLFKKAFELALLRDAEVSLLVSSPAGKLYDYASNSIEDTYERYQQFAGTERNVNDADQSNKDLQSRLTAIATWSTQNNADEADASELEKLEKILTNALRDMKTKKMLAKTTTSGCPGASTSNQNRNGPSKQELVGTSLCWSYILYHFYLELADMIFQIEERFTCIASMSSFNQMASDGKFGRGPQELSGAVDLFSRYKLMNHHSFFCKKPLPLAISDTHYLNNVVGDTEIRKGEGMELDQLFQNSYQSEKAAYIQPFDMETLGHAFQLRETAPVDLPSVEKGTPTISGKSKIKSKDKVKKHKKHKEKDRDKEKEQKKHKHRHKDRSKDKDKDKDKEKKKDKSGNLDLGGDHSKKHDKKRKQEGTGDLTNAQNRKKTQKHKKQ